jgi:hypothetical protein
MDASAGFLLRIQARDSECVDYERRNNGLVSFNPEKTQSVTADYPDSLSIADIRNPYNLKPQEMSL